MNKKFASERTEWLLLLTVGVRLYQSHNLAAALRCRAGSSFSRAALNEVRSLLMGTRHHLSGLCSRARSSIRRNAKANQTWWSSGKSNASRADFFPATTSFPQTLHLKFYRRPPNRANGFICNPRFSKSSFGPMLRRGLLRHRDDAVLLRVDDKDYVFVWDGRSAVYCDT